MEFAVIIELIMTQITIWAPSIVACLTTLVGVISAVNKLKKTSEDLKENDTFKKIHQDLIQQKKENKELTKLVNTLLDEITGVKGYYEAHKKEEGTDETTDESAD